MRQIDVAVIGSGPGGAVTAFHLAKAGFQIALLEEGHSHQNIPAFSIDEVRSKYRNAGLTVALGKPTIPYIEGRCLGGGSDVNSGLFQRCSEEVLEMWENHYQVLDLKKSLKENYELLEQEFFTSEQIATAGAAAQLRKGAEQLQWKWWDVPQLPIANENGKLVRKKSMCETYIPAAQSAGCELLCGLRVEKLVQKSRDGWVLHCRHSNGKLSYLWAKYVFICAGAIHTPSLLFKSGIDHNVGRTLAMHPSAKIVAEFSTELDGAINGPGSIQIKEFSPDLSFGCSVGTPPFLAATLTSHPESMQKIVREHKKMAVFYAAIRGASVGRIHVIPGLKDPVVRYPLPTAQYVQLYEGVQKLTHLLKGLDVNKVYLPFRGGDPRRMMLANYHLFGSAPCGENRQLCAVDSYGAVHNRQGLYVADASLFCSAPGVNPQATIMAFARRNALRFVASKRP